MKKITVSLIILIFSYLTFAQEKVTVEPSDSTQTVPEDSAYSTEDDYKVNKDSDDWLQTWEKIQPSIKEFLSGDDSEDLQFDRDKKSSSKPKRKRGYFRGGAGGWDFYLLQTDLQPLNDMLAEIGLSSFDSQMYLQGGGGWAFLGKGLRIGGLGCYGELNQSKYFDAEQHAKDVTFSLRLGGFLVEKVFHPFTKTELYVGTMLGSSTARIKMVHEKNSLVWDDSWKTPVETKMKNSFFTAMPSIGFRFNILRWCGIGANAGYLYGTANSNKWKINKHTVHDAPQDLDLSNLFYRVNIYFGG